MENTVLRPRSVASSLNSDPFRDPAPSPPPETYQPDRLQSDTIGVAILPREILNADVDAISISQVNEPEQLQHAEKRLSLSHHSISALSELVSRRPVGEPVDCSPETIAAGKKEIAITKWLIITPLLLTNGLFIFFTWWFPKCYYIWLPFITITVALNCIMVFSVILHTLFRTVVPEKKYVPARPESMVLLLPCYNETREECTKSLDSLVEQINIGKHKKAIMIVCDGRVRGAGMEKTTADYLLEDILTVRTSRETIRAAYTGWERNQMDVVVQKGSYGGIPYCCIIKQQNQGKRDSLLLIRSFLYNFNIRLTRPAVIFSPYFFGLMANFLLIDAGMSKVDVLIGMDADTVFAPNCIDELLKQAHYKDTVGICGYVAVDFTNSKWSPWSLYQSSEYMISQCLRRLHQSIATQSFLSSRLLLTSKNLRNDLR